MLVFSGIMNTGQACVAQTRILAPRSRYDEIVDAVSNFLQMLPVGNPMYPRPSTQIRFIRIQERPWVTTVRASFGCFARGGPFSSRQTRPTTIISSINVCRSV